MKPILQLQDKAWLEAEYATKTAVDIGKDLGCSDSWVLKALQRFGIQRRPRGRQSRLLCLHDATWLAEAYRTKTAQQLARELGCSDSYLSMLLRKHGIAVHRVLAATVLTTADLSAVCEAYQAGKSVRVIAAYYHVSIATIRQCLTAHGVHRQCLAAHGVPQRTRRGHELDETVFDTVTPASAYWIGFLLGDGCSCAGRLVVELAAYDVVHMEALRTFLRATHPIQRIKAGKWGAPKVRLNVRSKYLTTVLARYGIVPRKTGTEHAHPDLQDCRHFWRGVLDADGSIGQRTAAQKRDAMVQLGCSSPVLIDQFAQFVHRLIPAYRAKAHPVQGTKMWSVMVTGSYARHVLAHVYLNAPVALARKLWRARSLMQQQLYFPFC